MIFRHGYEKSYTYSRVDVGPTTATVASGRRQSLYVSSPTDVNSVWVAPNGNDANPGTQASPKLTIASAWAASTSVKNNIHIFRNGYVGDLTFTVTTTLTIPVGQTRYVQAADGEIALVNMQGSSAAFFASANASIFLTGVTFHSDYGTHVSTSAGSSFAAKNCAFTWALGAVQDTAVQAYNVSSIHSCIFESNSSANSGSIHIGGSGFSIVNTHFRRSVNAGTCNGITIPGSLSITFPHTSTIVNCHFHNLTTAIRVTTPGTSLVNILTLTVIESSFTACQYILDPDNSGVNTSFVALSMSKCYAPYSTSLLEILSTQTQDTGVSTSITNPVDTDLSPLFEDYNAGNNYDASGFRLQIAGKPIGDYTYKFSSPLYLKDNSGSNYLWMETVTPGAWSYTHQRELIWPPKALTVSTITVNPSTVTDLRGNIHRRNDGTRRRFSLQWGQGYQVGAESIKEMARMLEEVGPVRWYPLGLTGNLFESLAIQGSFDATTGVLTPVLSSGVPMIESNWKGFMVEISGNEYYIESNDESTLTLIDKLEVGFPSTGLKNFAVRSILVTIGSDQIDHTQQYSTLFTRGQQWAEKFPFDTEYLEWETGEFILTEAEDLD